MENLNLNLASERQHGQELTRRPPTLDDSLLRHGIIPGVLRVQRPADPEVRVLAADPFLVQELEQVFRVRQVGRLGDYFR